jgi:tetratricopeptide (TPR) repeat protein
VFCCCGTTHFLTSFAQEPTLFNLAHAYRKERFFEHAIVCLERCLALKESSSAYSALGFCLHLQSMSKPALAKEETNLLLQQAIDTYHQALAKKPDAAFCSEMLTKALGNTLEMRDFFVDDQDVGDGNGCPGAGLSDVSASGILKQDESSFFSPPKRRAGTSSGGVRTSSISMEQSSMEEALSLSLESNSDVDMS